MPKPLAQALVDPPVAVVVLVLLAAAALLRWRLPRDRFYTLVGSALVCFALVEVGFRVLGVGRTERAVWEEDLARDEIYPFRPGSPLVFRYPDNPRGYFDENDEVVGTVNAKGLRGEERPFAKPEGVRRIALLGDSFTVGVGVKDEHTLPAQLELRLRERYPNLEILNFGESGSGTVAQVELLERYALRFAPDAVILVFFLNDVGLRGTIDYLSEPVFFRRVRSVSRLANALVQGVDRRILHRSMLRAYHEAYLPPSPGWAQTRHALLRAQKLARREGFALAVAIYPVLVGLDGDYPFGDIHAAVGEFCGSAEIPVIDLLPVFAGQSDEKLWVHRTDQHPNEIAQGLAADALADHAIAIGLID